MDVSSRRIISFLCMFPSDLDMFPSDLLDGMLEGRMAMAESRSGYKSMLQEHVTISGKLAY